MKSYNFSTLITNYLYRKQIGESIPSLSVIPDGLLNNEELELKVYIMDHESQYGTPVIETVRLFSSGVYEHFIETTTIKNEEVPIRGHGESFEYLLDCFNEFARSRRMDAVINSLQVDDESDITVEDTLEELNSIPSISHKEDSEFLSDFESEMVKLEEEESSGVYLGINRFLDAQIGLITRGKIGLIAGNSGVNKTWVLLMLAFRNAFLEGKKVLFMTYEMNVDDIGKRLKAIICQFNTRLYSVRTEKNKEILKANLELLYEVQDFYFGNGKMTILEHASVADAKVRLDREIKETGVPYDLIVFDGATLIPPPSHMASAAPWMQTVVNLDMLSKIKLGKWEGDKEGIQYPIVLSGQLGKNKEGETLGDLGDSVRLGQDSDFVISLKTVGSNIRAAKVLKNRNGIVPPKSYLYAIDYNSSTLMGYVDGEVDDSQFITVNSIGWEPIFNLIPKKDYGAFFENIDEDILKKACEEPDLDAPIVYKSFVNDFIYPEDSKEIYETWSDEDQEKWTKFIRTTRNINLIKSYEKVIMRRYQT